MTPQQRDLIMKNQEILYTFRKKGVNLPKKQIGFLCKKLDKSFPTVKKSLDELKKNNIILDSENFLLNPDFAYFAGFYVSDNEVEVEVLNFEFEVVTEKVLPGIKNKLHYENLHDVWEIIKMMMDELLKKVEITYFSIIFNQCMSYSKNGEKNIAYCEKNMKLHLYDLSLQFTTCRSLMPQIFKKAILGDNVLTYTLYLREKVFESDCIVYYDLDQNRISYVKNNILQMDSNPIFGMIFPRFTSEQKEVFQKLNGVSDNQYNNMLIENKKLLLASIELPYMQIKSFFNPEHFIIGGNWVRKTQFEEFLFYNNSFLKEYKELADMLFAENSSFINFMNMNEQPQKGAGIFAAYSFFNWKLKW